MSTHIPKVLVNSQPLSLGSMDLSRDYHEVPNDEKRVHHHHDSHEQLQCTSGDCDAAHDGCHGSRVRWLLITILCVILVLSTILALSCLSGGELFGFGVEGLARRATGDGTSNDPFVNNKLYLIVLFVGLLLVIILGIMLSAWCCRGAFQNPLCCPCYLCACCGGLACLECIGCGLCAEGLDQV